MNGTLPEILGGYTIRAAKASDLPALVRLMVDDVLGQQRDRYTEPLLDVYINAFTEIDADPNNELVVVIDGDEVIATLQLTFIPYLGRMGSRRCLVEAVRVSSNQRSQGIGKMLLTWAIAHARAKGCAIIQLTTDTKRLDAHRFYERLGFKASHVGMKMELDLAQPLLPQ